MREKPWLVWRMEASWEKLRCLTWRECLSGWGDRLRRWKLGLWQLDIGVATVD